MGVMAARSAQGSFFGLLLAASAVSASQPIAVSAQWVDLSHDYSKDTIYWPTAAGFELRVDSKGPTAAGYWYEANSFHTAEHGGTHMDAPVHFARGGNSVDEVPLRRLIGPGAVVDVAAQAFANANYQATVADIKHWEETHGPLPAGAIVLLRTGHGRYWPDAERYLGTAERGPMAVPKLRFPGLHPDAAKWLVAERAINAVGIDTASIDFGQSKLFETHRILAARNMPVFENVANLERLPERGAFIFALPMKIKGGSGAPVRIVATLP